MKKVIFTTIQYNLETIKMLELMVKSFFTFNKGFDLKVYCLDNSKDKFEEYFNKFNYKNLEFINFKENTKWNSYLEHIKNDELTELEKKNIFKNDEELYSFDTSVCISKLEIIDLLLEEYNVVIASDIDIVYTQPIERSLSEFLKSGKFLGALDESYGCKTCKMSFCACFMYFNKDSKERVFNLMDKALYSLKYEDLREIPSFNKIGYKNRKYCFAFFEQDLLDYFIKDYFLLNDFMTSATYKTDDFIKYFRNTNYELIHFGGRAFKPFTKFAINEKRFTVNFVVTPLRYFYSFLFKIFDVEIDFNNCKGKFTQDSVEIYRFYASEAQKIKKRVFEF